MSRKYDLRKKADLGPILSRLKDRLDVEQVVDSFGISKQLGLQSTGKELKGDCPSGHPSASHQSFNLNIEDGIYYCWNCGISGDILHLISITNNCGYKEAARLVAEKCASDLIADFDAAEEAVSPEQQELHEQGLLYRLVYELGKDQLSQPVGIPVMDYLTNVRGYDAAKIPQTEWIYWDSEINIRAALLQKAPGMKDQIADLNLIGGFGDIFRLALPFRDRHGVIRGFLKRAHIKDGFPIKGNNERWDSTKGLKKAALFGLNRIKKQKELIVVEGYPDAAYLPALGLSNVVALGQAAFSEKYIDGLRSMGVKRLILALDNDGGTGIKNSESICRLFAGSDISVFIIDPPALGAHKDPDEYVKAFGIDPFKQLVVDAAASSGWMTRAILAKHDLNTALGKSRAIQEALEYADKLESPREAEDVLKAISSALSVSDEILTVEYEKLQEHKAEERLKQGIREVARNAEVKIAKGEADAAVGSVQEEIAELQSEFWRAKEPAKVGLTDFINEKKQRDSQRVAGQRIGFQLTDFAAIDKEILGLQTGLYVIAADPNIGKTAFMVSLAIDVIKSNADASLLFYSMDDSREMIVNRFLAHLADMNINEVRFRITDPGKQMILDTAYEQLNIWSDANRLEIRESSEYLTMSRIHEEIRQHPNRQKLVVFIDGLYNVPVETENDNIRVVNIDRANQVKQLVRSFNLPVLATAEFRKQGRDESTNKQKERTIHDIMESGKYSYNADLIILLAPKDMDAYVSSPEPILVADFGKNKLESFRGKMEFKFIRAKSVVTIIPGTTAQA